MATVIKEFIYSGTLQIADVPIGVTALTMHLWGGGGGSGGADATGPGSNAAAGHYVTKTDFDMTSYDGVKSIAVAVGGGGGGGTSGQEADGGRNGQSLTGYSGGNGGKSGVSGISGSGGGGGGATTVTLFESGQSVNNIEVAIAGGGAGSGGSGTYSLGGAGINLNVATGNTPDSLGENGAGHSGDGGGGGAGGGGADGGKGGSGAFGDAGGNAGWSGSNLVPSGGSEDNGSGPTPGGTGVSYYASGIATGGTESSSGGNGKAVLIFTIPAEGKFKDSGSWKNMSAIYTKVSGEWKRFLGGYYKVSGAWKAIWTNDILFQSNAAGFGNSAGGVTSGTTGTGGVPTISTIPSTAPNIPGDDSPICPHPTRKADPYTDQQPDDAFAPGNQQSTCFIAGTMVSMADGFTKKIEDVKIGEKVLGFNKKINTVIAYDRPFLGKRKLYSINDSKAFVTNEHPFMTENGWRSINPDATRKEVNRNCDDLTDIAELKVGDKIITDQDNSVIVKKIKEYNGDSHQLLYNFQLDGNSTYFADGYCVHNKFFVCTSMYQTTGLEDWKRAMSIWRLYHKKILGDNKEVQVGYHWVFRPYARAMRRSRVLRFIGAWLARHVTNHMKNKLYVRGIDKTDAPFKHKIGKRDIAGKIILLFWQPFLTGIGRVLKMFFKNQWKKNENK